MWCRRLISTLCRARVGALLFAWAAVLPVWAQGFAWDAQGLPTGSLGRYVQVIREYEKPLTVEEALARFQTNNPPPPRDQVLSFGIGAVPVWLLLPLHNPHPDTLRMQLLLGTTWMDSADVYLIRSGRIHSRWHLGDEAPYAYGVVPGFGYQWDVELPPQHSALLVRVQSLDPLVLPVQLLDAGELSSQREVVQYSYELMFAALFALILYNVTLFVVARNHLHARYALYMTSMLVLCICYTGRGLATWWPQSPDFQRYVILCAMVLFNMTGLNFAVHFLQFRRRFVRLGRALQLAKWATVAVMAALVLLDRHLAAVWWAFSVFLACAVLLFFFGVWAVWARLPSGRLFFAAVTASMAGGASAWLAVVGVVGYTTLGFRVMEVGFVVDACLLAIALGRRDPFEEDSTPDARLRV